MPTDLGGQSAKIYQFPQGGRAAVRASGERAKPVADIASVRVSPTASGSGWYHEAAIQEAERTLKR
jgi:hypothetical protein